MSRSKALLFFLILSCLCILFNNFNNAFAQETIVASGAKVTDPTNTGSASAGVSIEVPPGRNGIAPNLALAYNSNAGNGWLGVGWDLSLGEIQRSTKRGVDYSANDYIFIGNGASSELVPRGDWGSNYYGAKIEGAFSKFYYNTSTGGWEVTTKDGTKYYYGATSASRQDSASGVFKWFLDKVEDTNGNYMTVTYLKDQGEVYLDRVDYTGNANGLSPSNYVKFILESRTDAPPVYSSNALIKTAYRLKTIEVYGNGQLARKYVLNYSYSTSTYRSILTLVNRYGSDGATPLPTISFNWHDGATAWTSINGISNFSPAQGYTNNNTYPSFSGDFNGDGKTDIARVHSSGVAVYLSDGSGNWTSINGINNFSPGQGYTDESTYPVVIGDFNGDGKTDAGRVHSSGVSFYLSDGNGNWTSITGISNFSPAQGFTNSNTYPIFPGDFNGDGKTDVGCVTSSGVSFYLSDGSGGWTSMTGISTFGASQGFTDNYTYPMIIGDFNGDGMTDVGRVTSSGVTIYFSTGSGWSGPYTLNNFGTNSGFSNTNIYPLVIGDFNGDGKTDMGRVTSSGISFYLSDGSGGWTSITGINHLSPAQGYTDANAYPMAIGDFNGDGKIDVGRVHGSGVSFYLSDGSGGWTTVTGINTFGTSQGFTDNYTYPMFIGDFSGDGKTDIGRVSSNALSFYTASPSLTDLLSTINNGFGGTTTISYTSSSSYANTMLPFIVNTVSSISVNDGNGNISTSNFTYSGGMYNADNREFRGFQYLKATAPGGTTTETWFYQDAAYKGMPFDQTVKDSLGNTYARTYNTYGSTSPYTGVTFPYLTQKDDYIYDGTSSYKRAGASFTYDSYGNITRKYTHGDVSINGDERDEYTEYIYDTTKWMVSRPSYTYINDEAGIIKALAWFTYDSRGNLIAKTSWLSGGSSPVTTYSYNAYGNQTSITDPKGNVTTIEYESTYTYPVRATNALGHTATTYYDYKTGKPTSKVDPNGNIITYEYDIFGRLIESTNPHDNAAAYAWKESYFDGFGRTIKTKTAGPDSKIIVTQTLYNNKGQVASSSLPYFEGIETPRWTNYIYDSIGRVISITNPDNTSVSKSYDKGRATFIDANNHVKVEEKDVYGRLVKVEEYTGAYPNQALYSTTTYEYDVMGSLTNVTDTLGNQTTITYDTLGRKTSMNDPDMDYWTYSYDANGNLSSQTDAKGQTITFTYDALNRITKKDYPAGTDVFYTYDETFSSNSKGRLTTITDASGTSKYHYDKLGRTIKSIKTVDGIDYVTETTYDALGRTASVKYPDAETVNYTYDAGGNLTGVNGYVTYTGFNAIGQHSTATYANGVSTIYQYLPTNNRLFSITTNNQSIGLLNLAYTYDNGGNITAITDYIDNTRNQSFVYDDLNRIANAQSASYGTITYQYNQIGNITYNSQLGSYTYGAKPHAVIQAGANSYQYDANGNMTNRPNQTITYDYDNRPITINSTTFIYDYAGQRIKKNNTVYIGKLYECTSGTCTKYIFAGSQRIASKTTAATYYFHTDHLGSSSVITDNSGNKVQETYYYPFGGTRLNTGNVVKHKYTGQEEDPETGLYFYNARYYDPQLGRFISADSIVPDPTNPQALNRYSYVGNNPLVYTDPSGHFRLKDFFRDIEKTINKYKDTIVAAVVGFVAGGPVGAVVGVASNVTVSHTGEGRKITQAVAKDVFDDMLGLPPKYAYMASSMVLQSALSIGLNTAYTSLSGYDTFNMTQLDQYKLTADQQKLFGEYLAKQGKGGLGSGGGNIFDTAYADGGRLFALTNSSKEIIGFYADAPAFGLGKVGSFFGIMHTSAILQSGGNFYSSLSGFTGVNFYAFTVVCHQMANQAFLNAGFSNTVAGISGNGFTTYISQMTYGSYGGATPYLSYYEAEKKY